MRKIGSLSNREEFEHFVWILLSHNIEVNSYDEERQDHAVWILADADIPKAQTLLEQFQANPLSPHWQSARIMGKQRYKELAESYAQNRNREVKVRTEIFSNSRLLTSAPITTMLIVVSTLYFLLSLADRGHNLFRFFALSQDFIGIRLGGPWFPEIRTGEVWRLITPIFIHNEFFHIFFNMYWLYQLGPGLESRLSRKAFIALILSVAIIPNVAFYLISGPFFGGMSGVIYGLIGFSWMAERVLPRYSLRIDEGLIKFFAIYYVVCWALNALGIFHIANSIHGFGALAGILFALALSPRFRTFLKHPRFTSPLLYEIGLIALLLIGGIVADRF